MEHVGTYKLAVQTGDWAYFASVTLRATLEEGEPGITVDIADELQSWRAGAQFGIAYAYESSVTPARPSQGIRVEVTGLRGHAVDTTETAVAFAAAWAFWNALGRRPLREPTVDFDSGLFVFPK